MNRIIQTLLFSAVLLGTASAETMEERKQRIMRKYLRERQELVQSEVVLFDEREDERVIDSEKFQQGKKSFDQQQGAVVRPFVVKANPARSTQQGNWLLADEDAETDPYADPFSMDAGTEQQGERENRWVLWQRQQEQMASESQSSTTVRQSYSARESYSTGRGYSGSGGSTGYSAGYGYAGQQDRSSRYTYGATQGTSYGQQTESGYGQYGTTRSGASSSAGMLRYPGSSTQSSGSTSSGRSSTSGYTPYTSPYQSRQQQQSSQQSSQQQEFIRTTPLQKWKSSSESWGSSSDDAYVNELMQRSR